MELSGLRQCHRRGQLVPLQWLVHPLRKGTRWAHSQQRPGALGEEMRVEESHRKKKESELQKTSSVFGFISFILLIGGFKHVVFFISYMGCHPSH